MSSNPRTPRHFPRMKARGARRRSLAQWQRDQGVFDRIARSGRLTSDALHRFAQAFIAPPRITLGADFAAPPQSGDRLMVVTEQATFTPITAEDIERLATALTEERS